VLKAKKELAKASGVSIEGAPCVVSTLGTFGGDSLVVLGDYPTVPKSTLAV